MSTHNLTSLSEVIKTLKSRGFDKEFMFRDNHLTDMENRELSYVPDDLTIIKEYRFEGDSDPSMMTILYALEAKDGTKGIISDAYGANVDYELGDFMKHVKEAERE